MSVTDFVAPIGYVKGVNLNATGDTAIELKIPNGARKWLATDIVVTNASTSLSGGSLQFGIFEGTGETGSILANGVNSATSLTAADKAIKLSATDTSTGSTLYFHVEVANGGAATADVYVYGLVFPE